MSHPDDLEPGKYVAVIDCLDAEAYAPWNYARECYEAIRHDGRPLKILQVSLPFVCVKDGARTFAIDTRAWKLQIVSEEYAQAMSGVMPTIDQRPQPGMLHAQKTCPRCGDTMRQMNNLGMPGVWVNTCPRCGHNDGPGGYAIAFKP
jgi:hypothetical protein